MSQLFLSNVPWNCEESEVQQWIESEEFPVYSVHIIRDPAASALSAVACVTLRDNSLCKKAVLVLNGQKLKDRTVKVNMDGSEARAMTVSAGMKLRNKE